MYNYYKKLLLSTLFIVFTLITLSPSFAMDEENIDNSSSIQKKNIVKTEDSRLLDSNTHKIKRDDCDDVCECCHCYLCCCDCSYLRNWVLNTGIYAYNTFAGICGSDGYCCKTVKPINPCWSFSECCCGCISSCESLGTRDHPNRELARSNLCCYKIICCPLDLTFHLLCLPFQCCGSDCDSAPNPGKPYNPIPVYTHTETYTYSTNRGYAETNCWIDMSNPEENRKIREGWHPAIIKQNNYK